MGYRNYSPENGFLVDKNGNGDFKTITTAMAAASSGITIFLNPGTYTENFTITPGVNIAVFPGVTNIPAISGKITMTGAGTSNIFGVELRTNSDYCVVVSGNAASILNILSCNIRAINNSALNYTSSSASSLLIIKNCRGSVETTGITPFVSTSAGVLDISFTSWANAGAATTASSSSAGTLQINYVVFDSPLSLTSTVAAGCTFSIFDTSAINTTAITTVNTSTIQCNFCQINSGSASSVSAGTGTTATLVQCVFTSSNTNALTGAGTINLNAPAFLGSSHQTNPTTQTGGAAWGLTQGTAPSAGYIGEQISSTATAVATSSTTAKTIASVALTPGIWDIGILCSAVATGGTSLLSTLLAGISTTNNTTTGTLGIEYGQVNATASVQTISVPSYRVTLSANTTYYLVANNIYTSTTCPTNGRISATRVG